MGRPCVWDDKTRAIATGYRAFVRANQTLYISISDVLHFDKSQKYFFIALQSPLKMTAKVRLSERDPEKFH